MSLEIHSMSIQGDGIAAGENGPIYVPYTLPGETVEGDVNGNRIAKPRILTPSQNRVKPPCSHFKSCGGCALQHASDDFVAGWKTEVVKKALSAQGLEADFLEIITSPAKSRRRATFAGQRTKKSVLVGFHGRASETVVDIPNCQLLHPDILGAMPVLEELTKLGCSRKTTISLGITQTANGSDIDVQDAKDADAQLLATLGTLTETHKLSRLSWNGEVVALRAHPVQEFSGIKVTPPPRAFLQATEAGEEALTKAVINAVGPAKRIVDLFSGCGTFTLPLAKQAEVLAVEGLEPLLTALDAGWRDGIDLRTVTTLKRDLFRNPMLPEDLKKFDAVVIDPPRAGAKAQCDALVDAKIKRIAFVSCNPVTFARDAKILVDGGYKLEWVQVIDQFRWSSHVEAVALLTLE